MTPQTEPNAAHLPDLQTAFQTLQVTHRKSWAENDDQPTDLFVPFVRQTNVPNPTQMLI